MPVPFGFRAASLYKSVCLFAKTSADTTSDTTHLKVIDFILADAATLRNTRVVQTAVIVDNDSCNVGSTMDSQVSIDDAFHIPSSDHRAGRKSPLATDNLLEDTDGLRRPPFNPSVPSRCGSPLLSADVRLSW